MFEREHEFLALVNVADRIYQSAASWETKFLGLRIHTDQPHCGMAPDYADPDTTYEEDVTAYVEALKHKAMEIHIALAGEGYGPSKRLP